MDVRLRDEDAPVQLSDEYANVRPLFGEPLTHGLDVILEGVRPSHPAQKDVERPSAERHHVVQLPHEPILEEAL